MLCKHSNSAYIDVYDLDAAATLFENYAKTEPNQSLASEARGAAAILRTLALYNVQDAEELFSLFISKCF